MIFLLALYMHTLFLILLHKYSYTSGFWPRVRARALRAPAKLGLLTCQTGRCAPLANGSFAASYTSPENNYFQKQIASLLAQTRTLPIAAWLILSTIFWGLLSAYPSFLTSSYSSHRYYASSSYSSLLIFELVVVLQTCTLNIYTFPSF